MEDITYMVDLKDNEKLMLQNEFAQVRKNPTTAIILALFLGGFGAHHFYMGNFLVGVLYLLFIWTFIPSILSLIECFLLSKRVQRYNHNQIKDITTKIKGIRT